MAEQCEPPTFFPLVAYFFLTVAIGLAGISWFVAKKCKAALAASDVPFESDGTDRVPGESVVIRESWKIAIRELKMGVRLGVGNVGEVFRATYRGRVVAVKKLLGTWYKSDDMIARFREEIDLMSTLNHPNVLMFVGAVLDRDAGNICLVTELCERGTLFELLRSVEPLSWPQRVKIARDTSLGMAYVHNKAGIIQRDLKSQNILVTAGFDVKIADFGLARTLAPGRMQTYCGTPSYMAPEIVRQEPYTEKADVYSFGIVMWEILTREEPYEGCPGGLQLAYAVANEGLRPPIPAYCPAEWARIMTRAWSDNPDDRPTFDDIQRELSSVQRLFNDILLASERKRGGSRGNAAGATSLDSGKRSVAQGPPLSATAAAIPAQTIVPGPWVNTVGVVYMPGSTSNSTIE
jgi:serine/threonine protein kinase